MFRRGGAGSLVLLNTGVEFRRLVCLKRCAKRGVVEIDTTDFFEEEMCRVGHQLPIVLEARVTNRTLVFYTS